VRAGLLIFVLPCAINNVPKGLLSEFFTPLAYRSHQEMPSKNKDARCEINIADVV
jgi:hypothetical protein